MKILVKYTYQESYVPPRCRKPRFRPAVGSCKINIPVIELDQAPMAFRHKDLLCNVVEYRIYRKTLYTRIRWEQMQCGAIGWWPMEELLLRMNSEQSLANIWGCEFRTPKECELFLRKRYRPYLIIDGPEGLEVWAKTKEPRYVVMTFGLGHNYANTSLCIHTAYNHNIRKDMYFTALQYNEAVQKALSVAASRGDTYSFEHIKSFGRIEVFIPEAVRCKPNKEAGPGDPFMNLQESLICASSSKADAATTVIASALLLFGD